MKQLIGKYLVSYYFESKLLHEITDSNEKIVDGLWESRKAVYKHVTPTFLNDYVKQKYPKDFPAGANLIVVNKIDEYIINQPRYQRIIESVLSNENKSGVRDQQMEKHGSISDEAY